MSSESHLLSDPLLDTPPTAPYDIDTYVWAPNAPLLAIADQFGPVRLIRVGAE